MSWFGDLTGFEETTYEETRSRFSLDGECLTSKVNGKSWSIGAFEMTSLSRLRQLTEDLPSQRSTMRIEVGDVRGMHARAAFAGAMFQVASQFNALEMIKPEVTPEEGVTRYAGDNTQGPACALAAAPATIFRNYFVPVGGREGQTRDRQLDGLATIGDVLAAALHRPIGSLWEMRNGYALCERDGLVAINAYLRNLDENELDALRGNLSIGLQRGVEVTQPGAPAGHRVSQAFCSALPIAYTRIRAHDWTPFANLVLEAAYEATLRAAMIAASQGGSNIVLLTTLGGGVFGNQRHWIFDAIARALRVTKGGGLDIRVVSHGQPSADLVDFIGSVT